jgi:tetrahydromethanopterin S-methyltransferase subunit G
MLSAPNLKGRAIGCYISVLYEMSVGLLLSNCLVCGEGRAIWIVRKGQV